MTKEGQFEPSMLNKQSMLNKILVVLQQPVFGNHSCIIYFRARCAAVMIDDTVIAIGGHSRSENDKRFVNLKTAEYLVLGEESWKKLPPMNRERAGATALRCP